MSAEIEAALPMQHVAPSVWTASCVHPQPAAAAWAWATVDVDELNVALGPGAEMFGHALALRNADGEFPVPASMLLSGLAAGTARFAAEAASDSAAGHRLQRTGGAAA